MGTLLPAGPEAISLAAAALARGELVAFPTETVYGLGASAASETAIDEVFRLKGRPRSHPLIVHLPSADDLWRWADRDAQAASGIAPEAVEALATAVWPGPVTLVLRADANVPELITGAQDTVAVRLPGNETALALLREFGGALVAPSANRFGRVSPTTAQHVADEFPGELLVLDGGPTELGLESTIVDLSTERPRLLRPGAMASGRIEELLGMPLARQAIAAVSAQAPGDPIAGVPRVPGSLDHHYAPAAPVRLASRGELSRSEAAAGLIVIAPGGSTQTVATGNARVVKELPDDARGYAKRLYATLRELDAAGVSEIVVEMPPAGDEWLAVRDRLARASAAPRAGTRGDRTHGHEPTDVADSGRSAAHGRDYKNKLVAIVMGSASDWETMRHADELLSSFGVPHSCQVVSAHRTPARMASFAAAAAANGYKVIIAGAGGAAHLPGMIAAQTHLPVLGVPVQSAALSGLDSLLSQVQMPRGVPVGTLAIGPAGALNAALLAVAILAVSDDALRSKLIAYRSEQTAAAEAATLPTPNFLP